MLRSLETRLDQLIAELDAILDELPRPRGKSKPLPSPGTAVIVGRAIATPTSLEIAAGTAGKSFAALPGGQGEPG
jgi:hypothetical protein